MDFPDSVVSEAQGRSKNVCECDRKTHSHAGWGDRCTQTLSWWKRGNRDAKDGWEAHHKVSVDSGGSNTLSNCEILCSWCHKETETFGG